MSNELLLTQFGQNAGLVREFYELYQTDPDLVPEEWRAFFGSLNGSLQVNGQVAYQVPASEAVPREAPASSLQAQVTLLIQAYRSLGHLRAHVSPVSRGIFRAPDPSDLETGGLSDHLSQSFDCSGLAGHAALPLSEIVSKLQRTYCSSIGFEYTHLTDPNERRWLQERIESQYPEASALTASDRALAVRKLIESDVLENELHKKFPGVFYFSGLGNEVIVPALEILANYAASKGITEGVIGIAHRARMIVNSCVLGKPIRNLLPEFEDNTPTTYMGFGDVKYHARSLGTKQTPSGREIKLQVLPNPSHLEAVNSVVEGVCRAKQDRLQEDKRYSILPILIHGDAAFVGQGSVWETLSMSQVDSAATQGTLHFVLNNQIGFTTNAADGRSSNYSTDMAKAVEAPVFHVNAEDVDAVCWVSKLALDFRNEFKRDVVVDLIGYRKFGHNESDDPSYTQPVLYSEIKEKKPLSENYQKFAIEAGAVTSEQAKSWRDAATQEFKDAQEPVNKPLVGPASPLHGKLSAKPSSTKVPREALERIADSLTNFPNDFHLHPKLKAQLEKRVQSVKDGDAIEWGVAEALAFGSLVMDGVGVRLCGQDCKRGTFSHRHLVLQDYQGGQDFSALSNLAQETSGVRFDIYNSILSEYACMGFEFGYAAEAQDKLVMWEGQFGDFANGAQIIIDQFIAASECKWQQLSGLVLLLPHGYEGRGPEHSSCRVERFLQLCADNNMRVSHPSTSAQYFHLMREHGLSKIKRPLIVLTPKSLLRSPLASSPLSDFETGKFDNVIDRGVSGKQKALVFSSGKMLHEVSQLLERDKISGVRLAGIEQFYPFPKGEIEALLKEAKGQNIIWVQEEPRNMGAWSYLRGQFLDEFGTDIKFLGRPANPSTASGSGKRDQAELAAILRELKGALE